MHKRVGSMLIAAVCMLCVPLVLGSDCAAYVGPDLVLHPAQTCIFSTCIGTCTERVCSIIPIMELDQSQIMCILNNLYFVIGCGIVLSIIVIGSIISCCCKAHYVSQPHVISTVAVSNTPRPQPMMQIPYSQPRAGYMAVPNQSMYPVQSPPQYPGADNMAFEAKP